MLELHVYVHVLSSQNESFLIHKKNSDHFQNKLLLTISSLNCGEWERGIIIYMHAN